MLLPPNKIGHVKNAEFFSLIRLIPTTPKLGPLLWSRYVAGCNGNIRLAVGAAVIAIESEHRRRFQSLAGCKQYRWNAKDELDKLIEAHRKNASD